MAKSETEKLKGWFGKNRNLVDPPGQEELPKNLRQIEYARPSSSEPEEQYNIRIRRSLKKKLKRLVVEEGQPMSVILEKMLELYVQHRERRAVQSSGATVDESDE